MNNLLVKYLIGINCVTKEQAFNLDYLETKNDFTSQPLITGALIIPEQIKILIGQEIDLHNIQKAKNILKQNNITIKDLTDLALNGYARACIVQNKKYERVIVGLDDNDFVVKNIKSLKILLQKINLKLQNNNFENIN